MGLMELPSELLIYIAGYLGPDYFNEDIRRMMLWKRWSDCAWIVTVRDTSLFSCELTQLLDEDSESKTFLAEALPHIRSLSLLPRGLVLPTDGENTVSVAATVEIVQLARAWETRLAIALFRLAESLPKFPALRHVSLVAEASEHVSRHPHGFLSSYSVQMVINSVSYCRNITSLTIDITDCHHGPRIESLGTFADGTPTFIDLCCALRRAMPTLRRLRCRIDHVCGNLLRPPPLGQFLDMEELLVMLVLERTDRSAKKTYHLGSRCRYDDEQWDLPPAAEVAEFADLQRSMVIMMSRLRQQVRRPRMMRVLWHEALGKTVLAWDAVARKCVVLGLEDEWDAKGVPMDRVAAS